MEPIILTREIELRSSQNYILNRTSLVHSWKIITPDVKGIPIINGCKLVITDEDKSGNTYFNFGNIRKALRDILPTNSEENTLCNIEDTLFGTQLTAVEYYRYFDHKSLFDFLFTGDLRISFQFITDKPLPDIIKIEEKFVLSDIQLNQRLKNGEKIEDIPNNKDIQLSL